MVSKENALAVEDGVPEKGTPQAVRERLIDAASRLFAQNGFGGVSVRDICKSAGTSINMIHHYFGNKQGLLDAIVHKYGENVYVVPLRLLASPARSPEDLSARIEMLLETTLEACLRDREVMMVALREQAELPPLTAFQKALVVFLEDAKRNGIVREALDTEMISGAMLDRIVAQAQYAPWIKLTTGVDVVADDAYRRRWCLANADLFLNGFLDR